MQFNFKKISLPLSAFVLFLNACKKNDTVETPAPVLSPAVGEYVLSEGNSNNSKLAYRDNTTGTVSGNFFLQQNPAITAGLGDIANDMIIYGSKMYIVVNNSGTVVIANASNAVFIKKITYLATPANKPRYAAAARGKVYVTCTDNTVSVIDTASLSVVKTINAGANPEGIAASANYLYVANSGEYNAVPDSTVSLIDLNTELEIKKIKVGVNPYKVAISNNGNVYVSAYGNFTTVPASVFKIDGGTNADGTNLGSSCQYSNVRVFGNIAYLYNNYGGAGTAKVISTVDGTVIRNEFITDATLIQTPYGINIDEQNGDVYIADAGNFTTAGSVTCFNSAGVKKFTFSVAPGINPNTILFKR